jgi:hypothetical protein
VAGITGSAIFEPGGTSGIGVYFNPGIAANQQFAYGLYGTYGGGGGEDTGISGALDL